jgi:hypothetical protein
VVLPIGGYKDSGLAMLMDIFGGVISGANCNGDVGDQYKTYDRPQDVGHFFSDEARSVRAGSGLSQPHGHADRARPSARRAGVGEVLIRANPSGATKSGSAAASTAVERGAAGQAARRRRAALGVDEAARS